MSPSRWGPARVGHLLVTLWGASVVIWSMIPLAPGDPARRLLIARGVQSPMPEEVEAVRLEMGLDRPLIERYLRWVGGVLRGNFGLSWRSNRPVLEEFGQRFGPSLLLAVSSLVLVAMMTVPAAMISSRWRGKAPDRALQVSSVVASSVPSFLVALLLLEVVVVRWGYGRVLSNGRASEVWLPAFALASGIAATWSRLLRAGMVDALETPAAAVLRARGASQWRVLWRFALPNAIVPLLPFMALSVGAFVGGATVVESVVDWPGMGAYLVDSIGARDLPVIQGYVLLATFAYVVVAFSADTLAARIDPRRTREGVR